MATYQILGTYKVEITRNSLAEAAKYHGWYHEWLTETGGLKDDIWEWYIGERTNEINTIALIEVEIIGKYSDDELLNFAHGETDQAPWLEFYLDETGMGKIPYDKAVEMEKRRVCFFLHFVNSQQPIEKCKAGELRKY